MPNSALPPHLQETLHWDWPTFFTFYFRGRRIKIGLQWVPRAWTSYKWGVPIMTYGNQTRIRAGKDLDGVVRFGPAPIGEPGSWQLSEYAGAPYWAPLITVAAIYAAALFPGWWRATALLMLPFQPFYFAFTLRSGRNFRLGARWDDVDGYTTIPTIASRRYTGGNDQDTSTN